MATASLVNVLAIPEAAIDHDLARALDGRDVHAARSQPSGLSVLFTCRPLLIFAAGETAPSASAIAAE